MQMRLMDKSKIWLSGQSTLHPYSSSSTDFLIQISLEALKKAETEGTVSELNKDQGSFFLDKRIAHLAVRVPVRSLKSGKRGLDKNLYKAMQSKLFPFIEFDMSESRIDVRPSMISIQADGYLKMSGKSAYKTIQAEANWDSGVLRLSGQHTLKMSDFNLSPPVFFLVMKVDDEVTVFFDLFFRYENRETEDGE